VVLFHFREGQVYAYRYKQVPVGTRAD